jgi:hypothetical protein
VGGDPRAVNRVRDDDRDDVDGGDDGECGHLGFSLYPLNDAHPVPTYYMSVIGTLSGCTVHSYDIRVIPLRGGHRIIDLLL